MSLHMHRPKWLAPLINLSAHSQYRIASSPLFVFSASVVLMGSICVAITDNQILLVCVCVCARVCVVCMMCTLEPIHNNLHSEFVWDFDFRRLWSLPFPSALAKLRHCCPNKHTCLCICSESSATNAEQKNKDGINEYNIIVHTSHTITSVLV